MFPENKLSPLLKKLFIILFIPSILLNIFLSYKIVRQENNNKVKVIGVIDGDTIVLENKTRLRTALNKSFSLIVIDSSLCPLW